MPGDDRVDDSRERMHRLEHEGPSRYGRDSRLRKDIEILVSDIRSLINRIPPDNLR